jgi:hypothetical protein
MLRGCRIACFLALAGCLSRPSSPAAPADAPRDGRPPVDAGPPCTRWSTFAVPTALAMDVQSSADDWAPTPTRGDLELYFYSYRAPSQGSAIWVANRTNIGESFTNPMLVSELDSSGDEKTITLTGDGLHAVFEGDYSAGVDLFSTSRTSPGATFSTPIMVPASTPFNDIDPWMSADGLDLVFASTPSANSMLGLFESRRGDTGSPFVMATELSGVNDASSNTLSPTLSADGLDLFFASNRPGGPGGYDIFTAHRDMPDGAWSAPVLVPDLSSSGDDTKLRLSFDGTTMYMNYNTGTGNADLDSATRTCLAH